MSYIFTRNAAHDLFGIQDRIARDRPKIAIQWVEKLEERCAKLAQNPRWGGHATNCVLV